MVRITTLLSLAALLSPALAITCNPGTWAQGDHCQACQSGYQCPDGVNQYPCNAGYYANSGNTGCLVCPTGAYCPNSALSSYKPCDAGTYQDQVGQTQCKDCAAGTYTAAMGQTGCCNCCPGSFNSQTHQTHCQACANGKLSPAGSTSQNQCTGTTWASPPACTTPSTSSTCPASSQRRRHVSTRRRECPKDGQKICPILHGRGGEECVDVETDLESCGGCMDSPPELGGGVDCTQIQGARDVACRKGKCVVSRCAPGWRLNADKSECVPRLKAQTMAQGRGGPARAHAAFVRSHHL
ncbi:hypothetical protein DACRYDRAFT_57420 [Dacryopinax primogenitus]|uniref:Tyrosine-protein kinase ephrin type A/B receptor-like domain-containing protein n=1 Tax=Dacryopinax primogenitus (strain DJM 731) TaxID=1858805 RepID=M5G408_DACPD|nr:uncharacterized protein DACRYDRAFT_57420 [Dacryopinax primogenitus]EJT98492.1 hypothetical protein DACRYDRAFT_57420 [Dacryopinax primogenitus]